MTTNLDTQAKKYPATPPSSIKDEIFSHWTQRIHDRLNFAETVSHPRTQWPAELNKPPLKYFPRVQKGILKVLAAIFKDQRAVNQALISAVRETAVCMNSPWEQLTQLSLLCKKLEKSVRELQADVHSSQTDPKLREAREAAEEEERNFIGAFYSAFENKFRGPSEDPSVRFRDYLHWVDKTQVAGKANSPIIDLGCGRGEWLEILRTQGFYAKGVDTNLDVVNQCRAKGLDVICSDALTYLESFPEESIGGITGFHLIERLPFELVLRIFQKASKALKPGGIAIFETPNPHNLLVGAQSFYLDPTHRNPLPAPLLQFTAEYCGFKEVRLHGLNFFPDSEKFSGIHSEKLNEYFRSSQDYAVIGYRK